MNPNHRTEQLQLESELLSAILYRPEQYPKIRGKLRLEFFQDKFVRRAIEAIEKCAEEGIPITPTNVFVTGGFDSSEAPRLTELKGTSADLDLLTTKLCENHIGYILQSAVENLSDDDPLERLAKLEVALQSCQNLMETQKDVDRIEMFESYAEILHRNARDAEKRIPTGFPLLDQMLCGGLNYGDLSVLGGVPGSGKTSFMLHVALTAARAGIGTALLEAEMTRDQILVRMNAIEHGISTSEIRSGKNFSTVTQPFISRLFSMPFHLVECTERTLSELKSKINYYAKVKECKLILVDYLQVFAESRKNQSEYEAVSVVSKELRRLALKHKIHILAASSLNRLHVVRGERPGLSSLRSSGQLGHDAALAMFLIGSENDYEELTTRRREVDLQIAKNRDGARGTFRLEYRLDTQQMSELASQDLSGNHSAQSEDKVFETVGLRTL